MSDQLKVFISAVSTQFKACRDALASDLRAIGCEVKVQEDFQQGADTLIAQIEAYVDQCDRVIALVGDAYGCAAAKPAVPVTEMPRSYTQWEYYFALGERLNGTQAAHKDRYVYFASQEYLHRYPVAETTECMEYQCKFAKMIKDSGTHWGEFGSKDQLCRSVLRDGWQMHERPFKPCNLPYDTLGNLFKGRDRFIETLHEHLQQTPGRVTALVAKQAIHGLGGVGKTRLAVEYAWRYKAEYGALLFVGADSGEALNRNLAALCEPKLLNLPEQEATEEEIRVAAALCWFAEHSGWLLIFDNVDTTAAAAAVAGLFNQLQAGHVLVTSRLSDWAAGIDALALDVLEQPDAVAFLLERTQQRRTHQDTDAAAALALAKELDGLALALEQAGAYIAQRRLSIANYLDRWWEREAKVREWYDARLMHYPCSVAVTWDTSVAQLNLAALSLLDILCWFAPEPVPRALLMNPAIEQKWAEVLSRFDANPAQSAKSDLEAALSLLASYSLVKWEDDNTAFSLHRLVAEMTCRRIAINQRGIWLKVALAWVNDYLPSDPPPQDVRAWPLWEPLRGHVATLIEKAKTEGITEPTARLANELGVLLLTQGQWKAAEPLIRRALAIDESSYGAEHPKVAIRLNNLAQLLQVTNRLAEAEPLMRRALAIDETSFGAEHPRVAGELNNLAQLLQATNRLAEAEPLMRRALAIDEASYGAEHPGVSRDLNNLALLLKATNRLAEAEPLMRRALAIDETSYGSEHPNVAIRLNNLALLLKATNRLAEAEPLMRRALAIDETSYGAEHPNVAIRLNNLAQLLQDTNRLAEAEPLIRRALAIDETSYGAEHPNVAIRLNNLALLLKATNRLAEAEPLMRRALAIDETSYGAEHPDVAIRLNNLASLLKATNRLSEAEPLMRKSLEIILQFCETTGYHHPNLQDAFKNYTMLLQQMGRTEAEALQHINALVKDCGLNLDSGD